MLQGQCAAGLCLVALDKDGAKFFGFSEFLASLALMVLAWTIADVRYRFRVRTAPFRLQQVTFYVMGGIGLLTLLTDLWRAQQWLVIEGKLVSPAGWQALLGGTFLATFLIWAWFALIKPAVFGQFNALRYAREIYQSILRSHPAELPEIADELARSAQALVRHSFQAGEVRAYIVAEATGDRSIRHRRLSKRRYAYEILLMIADRKFCKVVVQSSPATAKALFEEAVRQNKFDLPLATFAKNITAEAVANRDSFAYHEVAGYYTGYFGHHKPLTQALYGNYQLVAQLDDVFDVPYDEHRNWSADQWEAFGRLLLVTFSEYVKTDLTQQPPPFLFRAIGDFEHAASDLYKLDGTAGQDWWGQDVSKRFNAAIEFSVQCVESLDKAQPTPVRRRKLGGRDVHDIYHLLADLLGHLVFQAATVQRPMDVCWTIQHNNTWGEIFSLSESGAAGALVKAKLLRSIYQDIQEMSTFANYKGARILGMMLNVLGLERNSREERSVRALHRAVLYWTKRNYARIAHEFPSIASHCLVDGIEYDAANHRLVKTGPRILDREPWRSILVVDPYVIPVATAVE